MTNRGDSPDKPSIDKAKKKAEKKRKLLLPILRRPAQDTKPERREYCHAKPAGTAPESKQVVTDTALDDKKANKPIHVVRGPKNQLNSRMPLKKSAAPAAPGSQSGTRSASA